MARLTAMLPSLPKNRRESSSFCISGYFLFALGITLLPCFIIALINNEQWMITGIPMIVAIVIGLIAIFRYKIAEFNRPVNAVSMMGTLWSVTIFFGMIPYIIYGMSPVDSLFESASGFTTVAATMIPDVSVLPRSLLFWRQLTSWFGGIMIIMIVMLVLPMAEYGRRGAFSNELTGASGMNSISMRVRDVAIQFVITYLVLSFVMMLLLMMLGLGAFDAACLALPTIPTAGFSCLVTSYSNPVKVVIIVFMLLGATNFYLHFRSIYYRKPSSYLKSSEFKTMLFLMIAASLVIFLLTLPAPGGNLGESYIDSLFVAVAASSTAAVMPVEMAALPVLVQLMIYALAIIGGSSGSTAGGIKIFRLAILYRYAKSMFYRILHPYSISSMESSEGHVSDEEVRSALIVITMFILTIVIFSIMFMTFGYSTVESATTVTAGLTTLGIGTGIFASDYTALEPVLKVVMSLIMWLGRMEIVTALAILSPFVWKEQIRDFRCRKSIKSRK